MATRYNTVEVIRNVSIPLQSTVWPGYDGCSQVTALNSAINYTAPVGATAWYQEETETARYSDGRHYKGRQAGYPPYRMTPLVCITKKTKNYLIKRRNGQGGIVRFRQLAHTSKVNGACTRILDDLEESAPLYSEWYDVTHEYPYYTPYTVNQFRDTDVAAAQQRCMDDIAVSTMTSFDALTELAEAREIPAMLNSISKDILNVLKTLRGRHSLADLRMASLLRPKRLLRSSKRTLRKLGNEWMQYRYGIMPLVYTYRDIIKTMKRGVDIREHKTYHVSPVPTGVTIPPGAHKKIVYEGEILVRAASFAHCEWEEATRVTSIGLNPLVTAWELIPFSFVIDWFVNVGKFIARTTSLPMWQKVDACVSIREKYTKKTLMHLMNADKTISFTNAYNTNWFGSYPPTRGPLVIPCPEGDYLLTEEIVDSYRRELYDPREGQLRIDPDLNWRRGLDSAAMVFNNIRRLLGLLIEYRKGH